MKLLKAEAGVNDGKAGLLSAAGLFAKGGIFDKKSESFNIQELDPYLLFDSRESMIGTLENPTLDLDPATPSTLDVITATRAGIATYTDPDGNIATASADTVRVDYTQGAELTPTKFQRVGYTDFSSGWAAQSGVAAQVADDYQGNAVRRLTFDGVTTGGLYQTTINTIGGVSYTGSFYIRRISGSTPLYMRHGVSASGNQTGISVTTEWQRFSVTMLGASGGGNVYFGILQFGAGDDVYEITQPQFEEGTTASSFVENTTGSPKFTGISATYAPRVPMVLIEPSAINLLTYSEDFSQWSKTRCSLGEQIEAPDGSITAYKIIPNTESGKHEISTSSGSYTDATVSVFAKAGEQSRLQITKSLWGTTNFDLLAGTVTSGTGTIKSVGNGWFRCTASFVASPSQSSIFIIVANDAGNVIYEGDETSGLYLWGAQLEAGSVATSYIPTSGGDAAARTRAADDLVISGSAFSGFFNGTEGTIYAEFVPKRNDDYRHVYEFSNGGTGQRINLHLHDVTANFYSQSNGATYQYSNNPAAGATTGVLHRSAFSYKTNDAPYSFDGGAEIPDTEYSVPSGINRLYLGDYTPRDGNYILNGHIKRLIYWPYHSDSL
jgi:hypothetical protein